jgi:hypothetical protein
MLILALLTLITVEGRVVDAVTQQPVGEARVVLLRDGQSYSFATWTTPVTENPAADAPVISVRTNDLGVFRFEVNTPAKFRLFVSKDGYVRDSESRFDLSEDRKDLQIRLMPEAVITGRVIDVETQKPVHGFIVAAHGYRDSTGGRVVLNAGVPGKTDEEGRYRVAGLPPGEYLLELRPPLDGSLKSPKPVEDFAADIRREYGRAWYPGSADQSEAAPIQLLAGADVSGIDFKAARRPMAALRGVVSAPPGTGEIVLTLMSLRRQIGAISYSGVARGARKPGEGFEVENLAPGDYFLAAIGPGAAEERHAHYHTIRVEDRNLDLGELPLRRGLDFTGRVTVVDADPPPPLVGLVVSLSPPLRVGLGMGESQSEMNAAAGTFLIRNRQPETYMVRAGRLPKGFLVREVRYNGAPLVHGLFEPDPTSQRQELELILAPANSGLQVTVTDGARPLSKASVFLVQEPLTVAMPNRYRAYPTDEEGRVTFPQLLPGKYRVAAYPAGAAWANDPLLDQRLSSAQEVNVDANTTATIQIRAVMQ